MPDRKRHHRKDTRSSDKYKSKEQPSRRNDTAEPSGSSSKGDKGKQAMQEGRRSLEEAERQAAARAASGEPSDSQKVASIQQQLGQLQIADASDTYQNQFETLCDQYNKLLPHALEHNRTWYRDEYSKTKDAFRNSIEKGRKESNINRLHELVEYMHIDKDIREAEKTYSNYLDRYYNLMRDISAGRAKEYKSKFSQIKADYKDAVYEARRGTLDKRQLERDNMFKSLNEFADMLEDMEVDAQIAKSQDLLQSSQIAALNWIRDASDAADERSIRDLGKSFNVQNDEIYRRRFIKESSQVIQAFFNDPEDFTLVTNIYDFAVNKLELEAEPLLDMLQVHEDLREELLSRWQKGKERSITYNTTIPQQYYQTEAPQHTSDSFYDQPTQETKYEIARPLLESFKQCFPEAADLIQKYAPAMQLVVEAAEANVTFGGYCEDIGGLYGRGVYRRGEVFVTRTETDPILAMRHFLFELTNGIHDPIFKEIKSQARAGELTREEYAYMKVAQEAKGTRRMAKLWEEMKPLMITDGKQSKDLDTYDDAFWSDSLLAEEDAYIKDILERTYLYGTFKGKTVEEHFMEEFDKKYSSRYA